MYAITVTREFAAAHALRLPDGTYEPTHGHNWHVEVTVASDSLDAMETVMDFHALQGLVDGVIKPWAHANLNEQAPFADGHGTLAINPSAERVAEHLGQRVSAALPAGATLHEVLVTEAPGCWAHYRPRNGNHEPPR